MTLMSAEVPSEVAREIDRQARALFLGRRQYVRALLGAVAAEALRQEVGDGMLPEAERLRAENIARLEDVAGRLEALEHRLENRLRQLGEAEAIKAAVRSALNGS
jgi:hypothetical protein